jgi:hypothetical protein
VLLEFLNELDNRWGRFLLLFLTNKIYF